MEQQSLFGEAPVVVVPTEPVAPDARRAERSTDGLTVEQQSGQAVMFQGGDWWEAEWQGMPAFQQLRLNPRKTIHVHFANEADVAAFGVLLGQPLTMRTRFIWFPAARIGSVSDQWYVARDGQP